MKQALKLLFVLTLGTMLLSACGDDDPYYCSSDDSPATCPDSTEVIDYCISGNGSCYFVVAGEQVNCGNCFDSGSIATCVQEAIALCPQ